MADYPNYSAREKDCAAFIRSQYPGAVRQQVVNGEPVWVWNNVDGDLFTFDTEGEAAADLCLEMGVTSAELNAAAVSVVASIR